MNPPLRHSAHDLRSRSLEKAASAFITRDVALSRDAHTPPSPSKRKMEDEPHKSNILRKHNTKIILTGATSGITGLATSSFTLVGLLYAFGNDNPPLLAHLDISVIVPTIVLIVVLCTGVFLAITDASTRSASIAFYNSEKKRETWEYDNYVEGEQREMVELYTNKGMDQVDAENVVQVLSKYRDLFVDIMMAEELQLSPIDDLLPPLETGISMIVSHVGFGIIPILPLYISSSFTLHLSNSFIIYSSLLLTSISVLGLGYIKSWYTSTLFQHVSTNFISIFFSVITAALLDISIRH